MEEEQPKQPKRKELFLVVFLRKIGKREERKVLQDKLTHEDAIRVRDEYARIGAKQMEALQEKLQNAELEADDKKVKQIKAEMNTIIAKTDESTFVVRPDCDANEKFLKPENPEFPKPKPIVQAEPQADKPEATKSPRGRRGEGTEPQADT